MEKSLQLAFPTENVPKTSRLLLSERNGKEPELLEVKAALSGRRWTDVASDIFERYDVLPLLTNDAFLYYLPRGILASLENAAKDDGWSLEKCIYNLDPYDSNGNLVGAKVAKFQKLTRGQIQAVDDYFTLIGELMPTMLLDPISRQVRKYWRKL